MGRSIRLLLGVIVMSLALGAFAVACGGDEEAGPVGEQSPAAETDAEGGTTVEVALSEWSVEPDPASVPAGGVAFVVRNEGSVEHNFVVIKTDLDPADLPEDGPKVNEEEAGEVKGGTSTINPGDSETVTFDLEPGAYVLICNIPGHYTAGMFIGFTVE